MTDRRLRSAHWKVISAVLTMITTVSLVWAIMSTVWNHQREQELRKANEDIMTLREQLLEFTAPPPNAQTAPGTLLNDDWAPTTTTDDSPLTLEGFDLD